VSPNFEVSPWALLSFAEGLWSTLFLGLFPTIFPFSSGLRGFRHSESPTFSVTSFFIGCSIYNGQTSGGTQLLIGTLYTYFPWSVPIFVALIGNFFPDPLFFWPPVLQRRETARACPPLPRPSLFLHCLYDGSQVTGRWTPFLLPSRRWMFFFFLV